MSHVVILLDKDGNEYPYYPEHSDGGRVAHSAIVPFINVDASNDVWKSKTQFVSLEQRDRLFARAMKSKRMCDISMCPAELLERVKEVFG